MRAGVSLGMKRFWGIAVLVLFLLPAKAQSWADTCTEKQNVIGEYNFNNSIISIYPNPFSTYATVKINSSSCYRLDNLSLELFDFNGIRVKIYDLLLSKGEYIIQREDLPKGVYTYRLVNRDQIIAMGKLVIE